MTHLAGQISLNKENKKRLQTLCLLGGIGHLPYTYATEEAVLLAARLSPKFRKPLERILHEVWEMVAPETPEQQIPYKQLIDGMQVAGLHAWLSGFKIKRLPQAIDIGDRKKLVRERITADAELNRLYRLVARVDYVQRDLYYTGLARFSLSAQGLLRRYQDSVDDLFSTPAFNLIDQLRSFLTDSLYFEVRSATVEALFTKKLAEFLVSGAVAFEDLLRWHDNDLDSAFEQNAGKDWWTELIHRQYTEICRSKVRAYRRISDYYSGNDTFGLEMELVGLGEGDSKSITSYPGNRGLVVLCKNSFNPLDRPATTDVVLSIGKQPLKVTPITEIIHRFEARRRDASPRGRPRARKTLAEDLLSYVLLAPVHSSYGAISAVFASGVKGLVGKKKRVLLRILGDPDAEVSDPEYWEQFLTSPYVSEFLNQRQKWVSEILRAAARESKSDLSAVIETASWVAEHNKLHKERIRWVLPNVVVESESGGNQIDVCSVSLRGKKTVLRLIECTRSFSEDKAVDDLRKLEKIKSKCRNFEDLVIEQIVYGASTVREHFAPTQQLLGQFRIKTRQTRTHQL